MKHAVITYIFGKNKEMLREPKVIDSDVEYICVTDQKYLSSKNWKIIYEPMDDVESLRDRFAYVKYNPFKYTNAEKICVMDSTLEIKSSLMPLFSILDYTEGVFKKHSIRKTLAEELPVWRGRGLRNNVIQKFYYMAKHDGVNLDNVPLVESCMFLIHNNDCGKELCNTVLNYMKFLGNDNNLIITNQCPLSYILHLYHKNEFTLVGINFQKQFFNRYEHNCNKINRT